MKLSKERRVYGAVLGVAGGAWLIQRVFFAGGPAMATASEIAAAELAIPASQPVSAAPGLSLAKRLEALRTGAPLEDDNAFAMPESWGPVKIEPVSVAPEKVFDPDAFRREHQLTTILRSSRGQNTAAVNGGALMRAGAIVDGAVLREVTANSAIFERDGITVELRIHPPSSTGDSSSAGSGNVAGGDVR
jgi:hypothetical protein